MNRYVNAESVELIFSGNDYFERLSGIIAGAQHVIHLHTYIIEDDLTGRHICKNLTDAAHRGVEIFFLADAFGSKELPNQVVRELQSAGINFRFFSPLFSSEGMFLGRRLHHKIIVADKKIALLGGINIADKYHGDTETLPWLDYAVLTKGDCCAYLHDVCNGIYHRKGVIEPARVPPSSSEGPLVRFRRNDWVRGKNEIHSSYKQNLRRARKQVTILGSYFLPGLLFQGRLRHALKRGVRVTIIVAGKTDVPLFHLAEQFLYRNLLKMGAAIYEWKDSILHGKLMVADNHWATIGSYNLNHLSHYLSIEMNVDIIDDTFSEQISDHLETLIEKHCHPVTLQSLKNQSGVFHRLKTAIAFYLVTFLMVLLIPKTKINFPLSLQPHGRCSYGSGK